MILLCFSHLRWDFVFQRPQHLMSRFQKCYEIYFIEEPVWYDGADIYAIHTTKENIVVVKPYLNSADSADTSERLRNMLNAFLHNNNIKNFITWYYSPMAFSFLAIT